MEMVRLPDEHRLHRAPRSRKAPMGLTRSPETSMEAFMQPSQVLMGDGEGGRMSAMGLPRRVTRIGTRVLPTSARIARQLFLNLETGTSRISHSKTSFARLCRPGGLHWSGFSLTPADKWRCRWAVPPYSGQAEA